MKTFRCTILDKNGQKSTTNLIAKDKGELLSTLRVEGKYALSIDEIIEQKPLNISLFGKTTIRDIAVFCRQFYTMLNAGVTIMNTLDILRAQTENPKLSTVISKVYEDVQKGSNLSDSLRGHTKIFPELLINMVEAGEASGNLDSILDRMANHYEKEFKINNKVKSVMTYPIVLGVLATTVVIFLLTFVMPTFMSMFEGSGVPLPIPTQMLLGISKFLQEYFLFVALGIVVIGITLYKTFSTSAGRDFMDKFKLSVPIFRDVNRKIVTSRFTRTLSTLLSSGVPLLQSLDIVSRVVGNVVIGKFVISVREEVRRGIPLATPIKASRIFPPMVGSMIQIGEESGSLDGILSKTADFYDDELEASIQKLTTLIEPLMIIMMALLVGFIVIAMILPMFDMMKTI